MLPVSLAMLILCVGLSMGFYADLNNQIKADFTDQVKGVQRMFENELASEAEMINGLIDFLEKDKDILAGWNTKNRKFLFQKTEPLFQEMRSKHHITHFYFHGLDHLNFLRVHNKPRFGDTITRFTLSLASQSQKNIYGIELGAFGTFTLRVVRPWMVNGELVGYIELGKEIEHITQRINTIQNVDLLLLIQKKFLQHEQWKEGLAMMGRTGNWDLYTDYVFIDQTRDLGQFIGDQHLSLNKSPLLRRMTQTAHSNQGLIFQAIPLIDAGQRDIGHIVVFSDKSLAYFEMQEEMRGAVIATLILSVILLSFFWFFLGRVEEKLKKQMIDLDQAMIAAKASLEAKSDFLATMSHEIRMPMNGVLGMTGILLESHLDQDQRDCANTVKSSAESLLAIINDILDFSKIESGKLDIEIIDFDLRVAVNEVVDLLVTKAEEKHLELVGLMYASVPTAVRGDPGRFRQILLNLVGNAIKFTEQGEVVVHIMPDWETPEEMLLRVEVRDTGLGLTPESQGRLFQPFSQADSSTTRKFGGTGLGLAISKQLVELMGGEIGVDSTSGEGSCFWFTMRMEKQPPQAERDEPAEHSLQGLKVCIVDDNDTNRLLLLHYTTAWGMDCINANNGSTALALLIDAVAHGQPCDLLILDMQMPLMDGLEVAHKVKADSVLANTRMVMLTSIGRRGDAALMQKAGISAYLSKPIHQHQLRDCLLMVMNPSANDELPFVTKHTILEAKRRREGRLLVADDNMVNQKVAVRMLERLGYRVDVVANGLEAVEAVKRISYHAVLMDCQMPEMDGYEATAEIRRREALCVTRDEKDSDRAHVPQVTDDALRITPHIPIIAITANAMQGDRERCLDSGMDDFISKPIKPKELEAVLDRWMPKQEPETREASVGDHKTQHTNEEIHHTIDQGLIPSDDLQGHSLDAATLAKLKELGGDDPSFLIEVIQQFLQDGPPHMAAIQQALVDGDANALMTAAHAFKGGCRNMGALPLGELCCTLEEQSRAGEVHMLEDVFKEIEHEYSRVQTALETELAGLPTNNALSTNG